MKIQSYRIRSVIVLAMILVYGFWEWKIPEAATNAGNEPHLRYGETVPEQIFMAPDVPWAMVNGEKTIIDSGSTDGSPFILDGRAFVPLRFLVETTGMDIHWAGEFPLTRPVEIHSTFPEIPEQHYRLSTKAGIIDLKIPALIRDGVSYAALRPLSEALGWELSYGRGIIGIHPEGNLSPYSEPAQWTNHFALPANVPPLEIPRIYQNPELPRGCEVTSLAMLLHHAGIKADKMELAREITKDPTPYHKIGGQVFFGHPNHGFVGDMYDKSNPGYGVYHRPVAELAERYLPGRIMDMTGGSFLNVLHEVSLGRPVWVIVNTRFRPLEEHDFQTWDTPHGPVKITYKEHSVLVTGYDEDYIYMNDPLGLGTKTPIQSFRQAWEQMGSQALTYLPE